MLIFGASNQEVHFQVEGEGPAIVLFHGMSKTSKHWGSFVNLLSNDFRVITIDARGLGRTTKSASWFDSVKVLAKDGLNVLNALNIPQAHILGASLGGMVALSFGMNFPNRASSVITINTSMSGLGHPRVNPKAAGKLLLSAILKPKRHELIADVTLSEETQSKTKQRLIRQWQEIEQLDNISYLTIMKQLVSAYRFKKDKKLSQLQTPTLVVCGAKDAFVPYQNSVALHNHLPTSSFFCFENGGHEIASENPNELVSVIKDFLHKRERGARGGEGTVAPRNQ